jgi:MtN3 and saliva related transmembrane protein
MLTEIIGFCAAILTTVAYLPQMVRIIRTRSTKDVSLIMYLVMLTGVITWLVYGVLIDSMPVIIANTITTAFVATILFFKLRYK